MKMPWNEPIKNLAPDPYPAAHAEPEHHASIFDEFREWRSTSAKAPSVPPVKLVASISTSAPPAPLAAAPIPPTPAAQEPTVSVLTTVEKDINIAETWITSAATKVETLFSKAVALEPTVAADISALVADTEAFLASATPAVAGEGLNFPADSVAYAAFTKLVGQWQSTAATIIAAVKTL